MLDMGILKIEVNLPELKDAFTSLEQGRKKFPKYVTKLQQCPNCPDSVIDGKLNKDAYKSPYLIVGTDALHVWTGEMLHVIFKSQLHAEYFIWMAYEDDQFVLRQVFRAEVDGKLAKIMHRYLEPQYKEFWVAIQ